MIMSFFNNHLSKSFFLFKNIKNNFVLYIYNSINDQNIIQSNQLQFYFQVNMIITLKQILFLTYILSIIYEISFHVYIIMHLILLSSLIYLLLSIYIIYAQIRVKIKVIQYHRLKLKISKVFKIRFIFYNIIILNTRK